jgi:hypothetical protein
MVRAESMTGSGRGGVRAVYDARWRVERYLDL